MSIGGGILNTKRYASPKLISHKLLYNILPVVVVQAYIA